MSTMEDTAVLNTPTVMKSQYAAAMEDFAARYAVKAPSITSEPVIYEFTNDIAYKHQYYRLRHEVFGRSWGVYYIPDEEDDNDRRGHIFVARKGNLVIGGFRIVVRDSGEDFPMPIEHDGFDIRDALPEFNLRDVRHAEISRIAILEDYNTPETLANFVWHMLVKCVELDLQFAYAYSRPHLCRLWRRVANSFGVLQAEISETIIPPPPKGCEGLFEFRLLNMVRNPKYSFDEFKADLAAITELNNKVLH
jgi:hypothetical protein